MKQYLYIVTYGEDDANAHTKWQKQKTFSKKEDAEKFISSFVKEENGQEFWAFVDMKEE